MRFAGIDVGSRHHVVAVLNEDNEVLVKPTAFDEDAAGYEKLFEVLGSPTDVLVAMEATGIYGRNLFLALDERQYRVVLINPIRTRRFAQEDLRRAKNDSIDALGIARFALQKRPEPTAPFDDDTRELREYVRLFDRVIKDFGTRTRQLHRLVHLCFPEFTRHVRTLDSQRATALLAAYPTAHAFAQAARAKLARVSYGSRYHVGRDLATALMEEAKRSVARHHGPAFRAEMLFLCNDLDVLRGVRQELEAELTRRMCQHEVGALLLTIDGVGVATVARVVAAVGDPARFRDAAAFAAYFGVVPGTSKSGLRQGDRAALCPLGNARLRTNLYMAAFAAIRRNAWLRSYFERLTAKGKPFKVALTAVLRKLLTAMFSVAKHRQPFSLRS
jgi:transposase